MNWLIILIIDQIKIENSYGLIIAENVWGALNGLETFSQLFFITDDNYVRILLIKKISNCWIFFFVIVSNKCYSKY